MCASFARRWWYGARCRSTRVCLQTACGGVGTSGCARYPTYEDCSEAALVSILGARWDDERVCRQALVVRPTRSPLDMRGIER